MTDLSDVQVANALGKHKRTIQRWCASGKLLGAYKAGRSWRIPPSALREAGLSKALSRDGVEQELRAAARLCGQLRGELEAMKGQIRPALASRAQDPGGRNWASTAMDLARLEKAVEGLADLAKRAPLQGDDWSS